MTNPPLDRSPATAHQLAVVGLGAYTGVMVAIGLGLGRYWLSLDSASFVAWFTPNFWFLLPTIAITLPFALVGTLWSWRRAPSPLARKRWRRVALLLLGTIAVTLAYHLPPTSGSGRGSSAIRKPGASSSAG